MVKTTTAHTAKRATPRGEALGAAGGADVGWRSSLGTAWALSHGNPAGSESLVGGEGQGGRVLWSFKCIWPAINFASYT